MMTLAAWWTSQDGGLIGGVLGSLTGLVGGMIGLAGWLLIPRARARGLVLGTMAVMALLGVASLIAGVIAIVQAQPYAVWYPLLLLGGLNAGLFGCMTPVIAMRYRQAELRRLQSEEIRRGGA